MKVEKAKPTSEKRRALRRPTGPRPPLTAAAPAAPVRSPASPDPAATRPASDARARLGSGTHAAVGGQAPARPTLATVAIAAVSKPTPMHGVPVTLGSAAAADWLRALGVEIPGTRWYVELALDVAAAPVRQAFDGSSDTRFHIHVYPEEWGFFFCHGSRASWIRVTERPFIHGRDDYGLLHATPLLRDLGALVRELEQRHRIELRRDLALVRTNVPGAEAPARAWVSAL